MTERLGDQGQTQDDQATGANHHEDKLGDGDHARSLHDGVPDKGAGHHVIYAALGLDTLLVASLGNPLHEGFALANDNICRVVTALGDWGCVGG